VIIGLGSVASCRATIVILSRVSRLRRANVDIRNAHRLALVEVSVDEFRVFRPNRQLEVGNELTFVPALVLNHATARIRAKVVYKELTFPDISQGFVLGTLRYG